MSKCSLMFCSMDCKEACFFGYNVLSSVNLKIQNLMIKIMINLYCKLFRIIDCKFSDL